MCTIHCLRLRNGTVYVATVLASSYARVQSLADGAPVDVPRVKYLGEYPSLVDALRRHHVAARAHALLRTLRDRLDTPLPADYQLDQLDMGQHVNAMTARTFDAGYTLEPNASVMRKNGVATTFEAGVIVADLATDNDARRLARPGTPVKALETGTSCHLPAALLGVTEIALLWCAIIFISSGAVTSLDWLLRGGPRPVHRHG